jgi:hypothetical protein
MKFTKTIKTKLRVKDGIILHLQLLTKTRPEAKEAVEVLKNYTKDIKYKYDKENGAFDWDVTPINNSKEVIDKITKVMALDVVTAVVQFLEGVKPEVKPKGNFKHSQHLVNETLKYDYPPDSKGQISLWDILEEKTKKKITEKAEITEVERSQIVEGIRLTASENKSVLILSKFNHEKSQNIAPEKDNYLTGNLTPKVVPYAGGIAKAPQLAVTLYEFTKEYMGGDKTPSGQDIENVANILYGLAQKNFLLRYKEENHKKGGGKTVIEIDEFHQILRLPDFRMSDYDKEGVELSKTKDILIVLHPIFNRQMDTNYILYPNDIIKRTAIAFGNSKVSEATIRLRDMLMLYKKNKTYTANIKLDRLYYKLAEKEMKGRKKGRAKDYTNKAMETMINLGLLKSYNIEPAKTGDTKVVFKINKDFK